MLNNFRRILIVSFMIACAVFIAGCERTSSMTTSQLMDKSFNSAREGYWKKSLKYASAVVDREPSNADALILKAIACENTGKTELALQAAREAVKFAPDNFTAQYTLGRLYAGDPQKIQDAIAPLLRALKIKPDDANTLVVLARCSAKLNLDNTIKYYERLAQIPKFSKRPVIWNQMGLFYVNRKKLRNAAFCFVRAYNLAPENHRTVLNLATFMDHYAGKSQRAVKFYKKYLDLTSNNKELNKQRQQIQSRISTISGS
jgi:tetratricopeptide (TPR) repeat protein